MRHNNNQIKYITTGRGVIYKAMVTIVQEPKETAQQFLLPLLDPVYTRADPIQIGSKSTRIGLAFTRDRLDPYTFGSAIRTLLGSLSKVIPFGSDPVLVSCKRVDLFQIGSKSVRIGNETKNCRIRGNFKMISCLYDCGAKKTSSQS